MADFEMVEGKVLDKNGKPFIYVIPKIEPIVSEITVGFDLKPKEEREADAFIQGSRR